MRHQKTRHKLSRDAAHRKALLANLCVEVIDHERIKTTEAKAKAVKPEVEKLITLAKRGDLHARRQAMSTLQHPDKGVIYKLFEEIAPRYSARPGGYITASEIEVFAKTGVRSPDASLSAIEVNGVPINCFRPDTLDYRVRTAQPALALVTATATDPGAQVTAEPDADGEQWRITVQSEDGTNTRLYRVDLH